MKSWTAALLAALLLAYAGITDVIQHTWEQTCVWVLKQDTQVYTPGTDDEVAATLPAGTGCRVDASVGDTWQAIEYMWGGKTYTGMVRADALRPREP